MTRADADPNLRPLWPGTIGPATAFPELRPGMRRRHSAMDMSYPEGTSPLLLHGRARDIRMRDDGTIEVLDEATFDAVVDTSGDTVIKEASVPGLGGLPAQSGFRRRLPDVAEPGSLLALLLDEVPSTTLISGSALSRTGRRPVEPGRNPPVGTCAGWIAGGAMITAIETNDRPYLGEGPPAPHLDDEFPPLGAGSMRRRRRLDVGDGVADVFFRDTVVESSGIETVVHEYGIDVRFDPETCVITHIDAVPHVLPGPQCPNAASSADELVGMRLDDVRDHVRKHFRGISTCTHLNDALRSLGDLFVFL